ncbi:MAG: hypothetical protein JW700_00465 [Candidatus Aenigmarchaeota archaeon]|nr:hypothetical protein [Candidatus Aenigmarchaeota archaeon]
MSKIEKIMDSVYKAKNTLALYEEKPKSIEEVARYTPISLEKITSETLFLHEQSFLKSKDSDKYSLTGKGSGAKEVFEYLEKLCGTKTSNGSK